MKIAILADSVANQKAGIHYYGSDFIRHLLKEYPMHEYVIVSSKLLEMFSHNDQMILPIRKVIPGHMRIRQLYTIPRAIKRIGADMAIELAHFGPFFLPSSIKRVTVIHDLSPIITPQFHNKLSSIIHKWLIPKILNWSYAIVANSEYTKSSIVRNFDCSSEKIFVHYPSLRESLRKHTLSSKNIDKISVSNPYILTVGTIEPRKNHITLLKAFEIFAKNHPKWRLKIVGSWGWKYRKIKEYWNSMDHKSQVDFLEYIPNHMLQSLYEGASLFVYPSFYEGFGMPVLEALQFGIPTIVANNTSLPEVGGAAVAYFETLDEHELADKMEALVSNISLKEELLSKIANQMKYLDQPRELPFLNA